MNKKAKIKLTISHNEVTENYSIMSKPSTMMVELNEHRTKLAQEFPSLLNIWGQQIWDLSHPNTFGKVIKVELFN